MGNFYRQEENKTKDGRKIGLFFSLHFFLTRDLVKSTCSTISAAHGNRERDINVVLRYIDRSIHTREFIVSLIRFTTLSKSLDYRESNRITLMIMRISIRSKTFVTKLDFNIKMCDLKY